MGLELPSALEHGICAPSSKPLFSAGHQETVDLQLGPPLCKGV